MSAASPDDPLTELGLQASPALPYGQAGLRVVLLEDDDIDAEAITRDLIRAWPSGIDLRRYTLLSELEAGLTGRQADILFCDLSVPDAEGIELLERALASAGTAPLVVLSSADDPSLAVRALEIGAQDYLSKGTFNADLLARTLRHSLARARADDALRGLTVELTAANSELEECLEIMAHDLRGPLRTGRLFAERLVAANRSGQDGQALADALISSLARMDAMVERLLLLASLRDDRPEPGLELLSAAVDQVAADFRTDLDAVGGRFSVEADGMAYIDRSLFRDLLRHLAENSIKYRSPDRPLHVQFRLDTEADVTMITVRDNGIGIAPEHHDRVFRLFERLHTDTPGDGWSEPGGGRERGSGAAGLGFGLACCRRIVELHRGTITLASPADGIGVESRIVLPATPGAGWAEDRRRQH